MPSSRDAAGRARGATVAGAFVDGWRRVFAAPAVAAGVLAMTFLLALPLAVALGGMLEEHLGESLEAERALEGWPSGWAAEFAAGAQGLGRTFTHEILGFGGTVATVSGVLDRTPLNPTVGGAVAAYVLFWIFLSGGILDRLARGRPVRAAAFFGACGAYVGRLLRLGLLLGAVYWILFRWVHPWLFGALWDAWTRDLTAEREAVLLRAGLYGVFLVLLAAVNVIGDFAKVRTVVEDRRSMVAALIASLRFIRRRPVRVAALYLLNVLAFVVVLAAWFVAAPSATTPIWWAFLIGQVYLLLRVWARLAFAASEIAFFQGELAHAGYMAAATPIWPDSPSIEAMDEFLARAREDPAPSPGRIP